MSKEKARHFHAGKLRKEIDGVEYVEVAESKGKVFVGRNGLIVTPVKAGPYKGTLMNNGYYEVNIQRRPIAVHRVLAEVFLGRIPLGYEVDHIDTDAKNNAIENLRIVTSKENSRNPLTYRKFFTTHTESLAKARAAHRRPVVGVRLNAPGVVGPFESARAAMAETGIHYKSISNSLRGECHTAGGYVWMAAPEWLKYKETYNV